MDILNDDMKIRQLIERNWSSTEKDSNDSISLINDFFDANIIANIKEWDFCIKVERKGSAIYSEQQTRYTELRYLYSLNYKEVKANIEIKKLIKNKSILIFDDSIRMGRTIKSVLQLVLSLSPYSVTVASLITRDESMKKLKSEFPDVAFISALEAKSSEEFGSFYTKKIFPYLEYICTPLQNDHPRLVIEFKKEPSEKTIFKFFELYGQTIRDESISCASSIGRIKGCVLLNKSIVSQVNILNIVYRMGIIDKDKLIIKIRIFLKKGQRSTLILQPMILEGLTDNNGLISQSSQIKSIDYHIKKMFLFEFLVKKFLMSHLVNTEADFTSFSVILD